MFIFLKSNIPIFIILNRRTPRTKSIFDRTSSRRYSSVDSNCSYDNQQVPTIMFNNNNKQDIRQNHLDLTDSTLRQYHDMIISSNGEDDSTVSFSGDIDDDDNDEYALVYFTLLFFSFFSSFLPFFFIFPCTISVVFCFAWMLLLLLVHHLLISIF